MKSLLVVVLVSLLVVVEGCALFYSTPKLIPEKHFYELLPQSLEDDYFHSPLGDLAGKYPKGWLQINLEHIAPLENVAFTYTNPERTWAMTLIEIPGSADLRMRYQKSGLLSIAEESINLHRLKIDRFTITRSPETFAQYGMRFANYEISRGSGDSMAYGRYVVFSTGIRYYELSMVQLRGVSNPMINIENYRLLQSVISSLEGVPSHSD